MLHRNKIKAIAEWLMEFSVLWAVFPLLDYLLTSEKGLSFVPYLGVAVALISFAGGLYLIPEEEE